MFCPQCGGENSEHHQFCMHCGAVLSKENDAPQPSEELRSGREELAGTLATARFTGGARRRYADFWMRFLAHFIDGVIHTAFSMILGMSFGVSIGVLGTIAGDDGTGLAEPLAGLFAIAVALSFGWLYEAILLSSSYQATVGKMAVGIVVTDMEGRRLSFARATGRYFAKMVSSITFGLGYIIQPFTKNRQALHDIIVGTLVMNK
jgi:uncharacterized RDD family membrane protein YckC